MKERETDRQRIYEWIVCAWLDGAVVYTLLRIGSPIPGSEFHYIYGEMIMKTLKVRKNIYYNLYL